jgi:hypothetical protein
MAILAGGHDAAGEPGSAAGVPAVARGPAARCSWTVREAEAVAQVVSTFAIFQ